MGFFSDLFNNPTSTETGLEYGVGIPLALAGALFSHGALGAPLELAGQSLFGLAKHARQQQRNQKIGRILLGRVNPALPGAPSPAPAAPPTAQSLSGMVGQLMGAAGLGPKEALGLINQYKSIYTPVKAPQPTPFGTFLKLHPNDKNPIADFERASAKPAKAALVKIYGRNGAPDRIVSPSANYTVPSNYSFAPPAKPGTTLADKEKLARFTEGLREAGRRPERPMPLGPARYDKTTGKWVEQLLDPATDKVSTIELAGAPASMAPKPANAAKPSPIVTKSFGHGSKYNLVRQPNGSFIGEIASTGPGGVLGATEGIFGGKDKPNVFLAPNSATPMFYDASKGESVRPDPKTGKWEVVRQYRDKNGVLRFARETP